MLTRLEEQRIISRVLNGDYNAFEVLVTENQKVIYNLALKLVGNENDALDISQEAFLKAYSGLKNFRGDSRFSVWMYKLTYNICIDFLRKKQRRPQTSLTQQDEDGSLTETEIEDIRHLPESELERKELIRETNKAIDSLSQEHRDILIMREFTGMSYREIADVLYINEGTVKSRIARARRSLAKILIENGTFSDAGRQTKGKGDK